MPNRKPKYQLFHKEEMKIFIETFMNNSFLVNKLGIIEFEQYGKYKVWVQSPPNNNPWHKKRQ